MCIVLRGKPHDIKILSLLFEVENGKIEKTLAARSLSLAQRRRRTQELRAALRTIMPIKGVLSEVDGNVHAHGVDLHKRPEHGVGLPDEVVHCNHWE
mgnify:CR=1 FL=1